MRMNKSSPLTVTVSASGSAAATDDRKGVSPGSPTVPSCPSTVTTRRSIPASFARFAVSVMTTRVPLFSVRKEIACGPKAVKSGTWTAPSRQMASVAIISSGDFGRRVATRSPFVTPIARSTLANRADWSRSSAKVCVLAFPATSS